MTASAAIDKHSAKADPLVVFLARCEARADLTARGLYALQESVDKLQADAEAQGLVAKYGQDSIQEILAEAFARWL
jgi:NADH:ubiquinone oxidoreductase subunit B-like Fe-S oxidoreductase